MLHEALLLFIAGLAGGMLNSIAGGGTFITFPALLFAGVPPIAANATNTFASCSGYISGAFAFRNDLVPHRDELIKYVVTGVAGGISGAWLLLQTPESAFRAAVPWLLLFATLLFAFGERLNKEFAGLAKRYRHATPVGRFSLFLILLAACVYGGFFNAGLGIIMLSYLVLAGYRDINAMNGLKLLVSTCISLVAVALFIYNGVIAWYQGSVVLLGTVSGAYVAARFSRQLPQALVRRFVIFVGAGISLYFFKDVYFDQLPF